jgi:hypothetical protein
MTEVEMKLRPFLAICILLFAFSAGSYLMFQVTGTLVHLLLLLAVLFFTGYLVRDTSTT